MDNKVENLEYLFKAMGSATRIDMLRILAKRKHHISGLAKELKISVPATAKHVNILEKAGLVEREKFGRTHVLKAKLENLYGSAEIFCESYNLELDVEKRPSMLDALKQIPGIEIKKVGNREYITSLDGEGGYYIYEVDGKTPDVPINEYRIRGDVEVGIKKLLPVEKKKIYVNVK